MTYKIGDVVHVRSKEGWLVSSSDLDWWGDHKLTIIGLGVFKWSGDRDYVCIASGDDELSLKASQKIDDRFLRTYNLEKRWYDCFGIVVAREYIIKVDVCSPWGKCSSCGDIIEYVVDPGYVCYSCRSNPYPSWSTRNIVDPDDD